MSDTPNKASLKDIAEKDKTAKGTPKKDAPKTKPESNAGTKAKSGGGFVRFVLVLVIMGGAVAAGWPYIAPKITPVLTDMRALLGLDGRPTQARLPSETQVVQQPQGVVETPAEALPAQPSPVETEALDKAIAEPAEEPTAEPILEAVPMPSADLGGVAARLDALESQVGTLGTLSGADGQAALDATAALTQALTNIKNELAAMSDRLTAIEDGSRADPTAPAQALVLGVTQLRARLMGDTPFAAELSALEHISGNDAVVSDAVRRLRAHAEVGVPSEAALTARFAKVATAIITARSTTDAGGWLGAVKNSFGGLVTIRRTDPATITDAVERAVAEAEAALELGALGEAVKALSALQGAPGEAAVAWLGDAQARVDAEAALEDLYSHALATLSAAGGA